MNTDIHGVFLTEYVEGNVAQKSEVMSGMTTSCTRKVLAKSDIENPMEAILDPPMAPHRMSKFDGISLNTEKIVAHFGRDLLPNTPAVLHHTDAPKTLPVPIPIQGANTILVLNNPIVSIF
jgi:hypothetical protein